MLRSKELTKKRILENIFTLIAPGTPLRSALNRIQEAELGALIVIGDPKNIEQYIGGGFRIDAPYTPQLVYELSKMDGAILLSEDIEIIYGANIQLQPDSDIKTDESGTRHRTADRLAKQTEYLVLAVSERRHKITVYKGSFRYTLNDIQDLIVKSSQAITALEKYSTAIQHYLANLTILEFDNMVTLNEVVEIIKKYALLFKIADELEGYIIELGNEGRLIEIQYEEIMQDIEEGIINIIRDYKNNSMKEREIFDLIRELTKEELLNMNKISSILGYGIKSVNFDEKITPKGYRIISTIKRLSKKDIDLVVEKYDQFSNILSADAISISKVKGISKLKADHIARGLLRIKNTLMMEK